MTSEEKIEHSAVDEIELLAYPPCPGEPPAEWNGWFEADGDGTGRTLPAKAKSAREPFGTGKGSDERMAEEVRRSFEAGRERGRNEGRQLEREAQGAQQMAADEQRMRQAGELIARFALERDRYLHLVEQEVVKLALAVAARILRREAQMDPLLLTGAVRVALGQLAGTTEVRLLVPPAELELWTDAMAHLPNLAVKPTVLARDGMRLGDCVIETSLGSVDLGIRAQLGEIERGFFDSAGKSRPAAESNPVPPTAEARE